MNTSIANIILLSIMVNPCRLLPVPRDNIPETSSSEQFREEKKNDIHNNVTSPVTKIVVKSDQFNGMFTDRNKRSDDSTSISVFRRLRDRQTMGQFSQQNLANNRHDASNLEDLLWHQFHGQNSHPQLSPSGLKSPPLSSPITNHPHTLLSQETARLDPMYVPKKPETETKGTSSSDNVFIDLLHNQPATTESNTNRFGSLPKIFSPYVNSFSAGLASSVKDMTPSKDCALVVNMLPILLMNSFVNAITTISNLQLANSLMIPFVVLSVINFIASFLFMEDLCPDSRY